MPITPQQARAELARRELARREQVQSEGKEIAPTKRPSYFEAAIKPFGGLGRSAIKGYFGAIPKLKIPEGMGLRYAYPQSEREAMDRELTMLTQSEYQPKDTGEKVAEALGSFGMASQFMRPFFTAAETLPYIRKAWPIVKTMAAGAGYGGTRAAIEGRRKEILPEAAKTAGQFAAFHFGGRLGSTLGAKVGKFMPKVSPETLQRFGSAFGGGAVGAATSPEEPEVGAVFGAGLGMMYPGKPFGKTVENLDNFIDTSIEKAIRPSVVGKKTYGSIEAYKTKTREAIKTIYQNRENLGLTDELGEPVKRMPQSLKDLSQGVENTKTYIFKIYDTLAKQAGEKGWVFNPDTVTAKLYEVSKDLKFSPQIRKYAENLMPEIEELRGTNPEVLQERIREMNSSLESYYNNRVDKAKARVDASVANLLRQELDSGVSEMTGARYQLFKDKYGALKTLEKDLNRRLVVDARKNLKGFFDITDIFSGGQIVSGLLNLNPGQLAAGVTSKGILTWYKWINNPNRIVKDMFTTIDKVSKGEMPSRALTRFNKFTPKEETLNEMQQQGLEESLKGYTKGEATLSQVILQNGGIKAYGNKNLSGGLREEYKTNIPNKLKNKNGLSLDEMAATIKKSHPQLGINSEVDLLNALARENQPKAGGLLPSQREGFEQSSQFIKKKGFKVGGSLGILGIEKNIPLTDIFGQKKTLPKGEEYKAIPLGNKFIRLHDGQDVIVNKNQFQNISNQSNKLSGFKSQVKSLLSPEEAQVEEVVKGVIPKQELTSKELKYYEYLNDTRIANGMSSLTFKEQQEFLRLNDKVKDTTKFSQYQLPGGENYKEVLFKAPTREASPYILVDEDGVGIKDFKNYQEAFDYYHKVLTPIQREGKAIQPADSTGPDFKSSHWDEPNVLSHARINDRTTAEGKKILFIEEIQSDWAKRVRELGAGKSEEWKSSIPSHPLLKNWQEFTLKRILQKAVAEGYDGIAWTIGEQQAERYDLSKQMDEVDYFPETNELRAFKDERIVIDKKVLPEGLPNIVGKDIAKKLLESPIIKNKVQVIPVQRLEGFQLKIGGEWAKNLYDRQIPNILKDLTKGEVGSVEIGSVGKKRYSIEKQSDGWEVMYESESSGTVDYSFYRTEQAAQRAADKLNKSAVKEKAIQPALMITPEMKARVLGQPIKKTFGRFIPTEITDLYNREE